MKMNKMQFICTLLSDVILSQNAGSKEISQRWIIFLAMCFRHCGKRIIFEIVRSRVYDAFP